MAKSVASPAFSPGTLQQLLEATSQPSENGTLASVKPTPRVSFDGPALKLDFPEVQV